MGNCLSDEEYDMSKLGFDFFSEERIIGKGGFGIVYAVRKKFASDEENEVFYAAKELDKYKICMVKGLPQMILNELKIMIEISEGFGGRGAKFLMNMECAFMSTDKLYIVQDLMDGGDLHFNMMHRTRSKRFSLERIKWYAACCVLGLQEIHSLGFLHRDIKPANMLLGKDGYAKLADFGLCGRLNSSGHCYARGGTLSFMSPESRNKEKKGRHGIEHDFFGMGVMIYVMFTCQYPFSKFGNFNTVIAAHLSELSVGINQEKHTSPKEITYDQGSSAGASSALRNAALELEAAALPAHYQLDEKQLRKLPNLETKDFVKGLLMMNERYRLGTKGAGQVMKHKFFDGVDFEAMKNHTAVPPSKPDTTRASVHTGQMDLMKLLGNIDGDDELSRPALTEEQQAHFKDFRYNPYITNPSKAVALQTRPRRMSLAPEDNVMLPGEKNTPTDGDRDDNDGSTELIEVNKQIRKRRGSGSLSRRASSGSPMPDLGGIVEEKIDPRTGKAITSENPYNNYNPADLGNLPADALTPKNGKIVGSKKIFPMETVPDSENSSQHDSNNPSSKYEVYDEKDTSSLLPEFEAAAQEIRSMKEKEISEGEYPEMAKLIEQQEKMERLLVETKKIMAESPDALKAVYKVAVDKCQDDLYRIIEKIDGARGGRRVTLTLSAPRGQLPKGLVLPVADGDEDEDEDEDEEEEKSSGLTIPTGFHDAIIKLLKHGRITKDAATALLTAMANGNQVLQTIYKAFTVNKDAKAFLAMIVHLVTPEKEKTSTEAVLQSVPPAESAPAPAPAITSEELSEELKDRFATVFSQCLQLLIARGMLDEEGCRALMVYAKDNMPALMGLLEDFNTTADLEALLGQLTSIAASLQSPPPSAPPMEDVQAEEEKVDAQLIKVLGQCIEVMLKRQDITIEGAKVLLEMAKSKAPILLAQLAQSFDANLDLEKLLASLATLAQQELNVRRDVVADEEDEKDEEAKAKESVTDGMTKVVGQVIELVRARTNLISEDGVKFLHSLANQQSSVLYSVLQTFHATQNLEDLIENIVLLSRQGPDSNFGKAAEEEKEEGVEDSSDEDNEKVQPLSSVERRRSLSLTGIGDLNSEAAVAPEDYDEEDEEDEDNDDSRPTLEMLTHPSSLTHLIVMLHDAGLASVAERAVLLNLAEEGDPRCLAAFDVYRDMLTAIENDAADDDEQKEIALDDLVDTCMRICKRELSHGPYHPRHASFSLTDEGVIELQPNDADVDVDDEGGAARDAKEEDGIELKTFSESFDAKDDEFIGAGPGHQEEEGASSGATFSTSDRLEVIKMMMTSGVLTEEEAMVLELLVEKENRHIDMTFEVYESGKDVVELAMTLKKIAQTAGDFLADSIARDKAEAAEVEEEPDIDPEGSAYDVFFRHVEAMNLDDIETAALRLCIAKNDAGLRAALEAFRITENGADLKDTLWKIIRRAIDEVEVKESASASTSDAATATTATTTEESPAAEKGDAEKFTDMERRYIFTMLISELSKQNIISAVQGSELLSRFNAGDKEILSYLDKYEVERDMEVFVGKLTTIAKTI